MESNKAKENVEKELSQLNGKLDRLSAFIMGTEFKALSEAHRVLLLTQRDAMITYATILALRLDIWKE